MYLKIRDKEYRTAESYKYRTQTGVFEVLFPENGIFGVIDGGVSKAVADGRYVITEPLAKGNYTIIYKSSLNNCEGENCVPYSQDITYTIIAQ